MTDLVSAIPTPDEVKQRLADNRREAEVLRSLLKASERRARVDAERKQRPEVANAK
jgi:hypothetical protein